VQTFPNQDSIRALFSLEGRSIVVTGASRGIGHALAEGLALAGGRVLALARSAEPERQLPPSAHYSACDVADIAAFDRALEAFVGPAREIDVLVNAAGISHGGGDAAAFDATLAVNLRAPYMCMQAVAPGMARRGRGAIVNVTSLGAHRGFPGNPGYVAAKGGLSQLTQAMAVDLGPKGIRVNNLVPGYVRTAMTARSYADPIENARRRNHTMLGRWGDPGDLVGAAIFLASDASAYVTGCDLPVDGGWLAKGLV